MIALFFYNKKDSGCAIDGIGAQKELCMMNVFTATNYARCKSSGKKRFRDRKEAKRVVIRSRRMRLHAEREGYSTHRLENRTYRCYDCGGWHVTSQQLKF